MKILCYIVLSFFLLSNANGFDLQNYRIHYSRSSSDKALCEKMMEDLEREKESSAIYLGYLGGYQTIWAKHVFNPVTKLNTFKMGSKKIEQAIKQQPNNVELRFIRLSVQVNAPTFLGYHSHIEKDKEFIIKNRKQIQSEIVNRNIDLLLKE